MTRKLTTAVLCAAMALTASAQMKVRKPMSATATPLKRPVVTEDALKAVRRVSLQEALALMNQGKAVVVDVRSNDSFALGHIRGAVNIPGSQLLGRLRELPVGKTIITYCACSAEQSSGRAVLELNGHGIRNAAALKGGWHAWQNAGMPSAIGRK